jgi:hypothetical protein
LCREYRGEFIRSDRFPTVAFAMATDLLGELSPFKPELEGLADDFRARAVIRRAGAVDGREQALVDSQRDCACHAGRDT